MKDRPIIALTAGITTGEHKRARTAGMNDVLAKPFDPPALVRCIRMYAQRHEQGPVAARPLAAEPQAWPQIDGIDTHDVRTRLGGDVALLRSLLLRLLDDFAGIGEEDRTEPAMLAGRLHNLMGSAGTLGAKRVERLAAQAEEACRAGDLRPLEALVPQVAAALASLRSASAAALEASAEESPEQASPGDLDAPALKLLLEQLRRFDLAAVDTIRTLAPHLRPLLGPQAFASVQMQIDKLLFAPAASTLQGIENS